MWLVCTGAISGNLPFRLSPGQYVVGRTRTANIVVKDLTVSKRHARLVCTGKALTVEDLDSRNGTFVDEQPAEQTPAEIGSRIRFGAVVCMVCPTAMMPTSSEESESTFDVGGANLPTIAIDGLTPAQQQVLRLVLRGLDEDAIATELRRSWHTVHTHLKAIFKHFEVHTRVELVAKLLRTGPAG